MSLEQSVGKYLVTKLADLSALIHAQAYQLSAAHQARLLAIQAQSASRLAVLLLDREALSRDGAGALAHATERALGELGDLLTAPDPAPSPD